jgi:hypothetical protein
MELHDALAEIAEIRLRVERTNVFRGYRSLPVAFSGLLAFAAALVQGVWLPEPMRRLPDYLALWIGVALVSMAAAGAEMALRARRSGSPLACDLTRLAVEQFLPCLVAGALLTYAIARFAAESTWLLPGLWQILFSLGVFASHRLLPRSAFGVGVFYLFAGLACIALARGAWALSPWAMGIPFGAGQLLAAAVLYWTLERAHGTY